MGNGWDMTLGTFNRADSRESLIGDGHQMALDRETGRAQVQGAAWNHTGDDMRVNVAVYNNNGGAEGSGTTAGNDSSMGWNVRVEYLAEGSWGQFDEFTSADGSTSGTLVGFSYRTADAGDGAATNEDDVDWNLDVQMQMGGSNLYVSYHDSEDDSAGTSSNRTQVMWSTWIDSDWELYVRYLDDDATPLGEVTSIGVNQYWAGHNAKWTTQYDVDETAATDSTTITTQVQLMF